MRSLAKLTILIFSAIALTSCNPLGVEDSMGPDTSGSSSQKEITVFSILDVNGAISGTGVDMNSAKAETDIVITLPYGTNVTSLKPTIIYTGASVTPASGMAQDFTSPVRYTVTATDGTTKIYTVHVSVAVSDAREITTFSILDVNGAISGTDIAVTLPYGTDVTALAPAIIHTGASIDPASGAPQDFTSPVKYTVTAADSLKKVYTVTVTVAANSAKDITTFSILSVNGAISGTDIALTLSYGTDVTSLTPTIVHTGADIDPASGAAQDFTDPVDYTVTAANGTTKIYTVHVSVAANSAKEITSFSILGADGVITGTDIDITLPYGTNVTSLTPTIIHTGASMAPVSGIAQNFTNPVLFTVTAANGTTKVYTATVTVAANSAKEITTFSIMGVNGAITGTDISLTLPYGTDVTSLTPAIIHTGASVDPASGVPQDFTDPVEYTVTAANGTTKVYTAAVTVAANTAKEITTFSVLGVNGAISETDIVITLPYGTDKTSLTPTIIHTGAGIDPASGVPQDFTDPVEYTVTAANGTIMVYTVTVTVAANSAKDITTFSILGVNGAISGTDISVTLPFGTDVTSLAPAIIHTGASTDPASGAARNFTNPVPYTVFAADGTIKVWTVTVTVSANTAKEISTFSILSVNGAIAGTNIALTLPFGTDVTSLAPVIIHTGASVSPDSGAAQDFTDPVEYTVTAANGTTKIYTVTAGVATNSAKELTTFSILGVNGAISGTDIALTLPFGTDATSLTPTIVHTGASVNPASGVAQNFTNPVSYTVTAANGTTKAYTIYVSVAANSAKELTTFSILGVNGAITGTDISITLPAGTDVTALTPAIVHTGASVNPASGAVQNFTNPVPYTVTAANGATKIYSVYVTVAANNAKEITTFSIDGVNGAIIGTDIAITLPYGTDPASLTPTIIHTGASIDPASGGAQDFTNPVPYTVTAANGTTKLYTVTVIVAANSAKNITTFSILGVNGAITGTDVAITLPYGTNVTSLAPTTITHTGTGVAPASGVPQNFTSSVPYTVTAANGTINVYTVTVTVAADSAKELTTFSIFGINGVIAGTDIAVALPAGTVLTSLTPAIIHTGASVAPASGVAQNFTNPVPYTVTAANGGTKIYTVTVTNSPTAPVVSATTPTTDTTPTWTWVGGGGGSGNYRYKLDNSDLNTGATLTAALSYTPAVPLDSGVHTLYVQERDNAGNWSASGSRAVTIETCNTVLSWGRNLNGQLGLDVALPFVSTPQDVPDLTDVTKVVGGGSAATATAVVPFTVAMKSDGTVWSWGTGDSGQLGIGTLGTQGTPQQVEGLSDITDVAAGASFALALDGTDGSVWSWGLNSASGQLGDGTATSRLLPVRVGSAAVSLSPLSGITKIATAQGTSHSLAIAGDETVWAWGLNSSAQLGDGTAAVRTIPVQVADPVTRVLNVASVAVTNATTITVTTVGNHNLQVGNRIVMTGWTGTGVNGTFLVATAPVGTPTIFTYTTAGAVGPSAGGTATATLPSALLPILTVTGNGALITVTNSVLHGLAVGQKVQVTMAGWTGGTGEWNGTYEVTATTTSAFTYVATGNGIATGGTAVINGGTGALSGVVDIATGPVASVALKDDGTVWAWGANASGQLGEGRALTSYLPIQTIDSVSKVLNVSSVAVAATTVTVTTTGNHDIARLGASIGPFVVMSGWTGVGVNGTFLIATSAATNTFTYTTAGASGPATGGTATVYMPSLWLPTTVSGDGETVTVTSTAHGLAVGQKAIVTMAGWAGGAGIFNGTYEVTATTANAFTYEASGSGAPTGGTCILNSGVIVDTVTGDGATVTVTSTGNHNLSTGNKVIMSGWAGGAGTWNGTYSITVLDATTFTYASDGDGTATGGTISGTGYLENVAEVSAGTSFTVARKADGTVWAWGLGTNGQLGNNGILTYFYPVPVLSSDGVISGITEISAGTYHTVAVKSDGTVWAWGYNASYQLGDGTNITRKQAVQLADVVDAAKVSSSYDFTVMTTTGGTVKAWGAASYSPLGIDEINKTVPTPMFGFEDDPVLDVSGGVSHSVVVRASDGSVWTTGLNTSKQLGYNIAVASVIGNGTTTTVTTTDAHHLSSGVNVITAGWTGGAGSFNTVAAGVVLTVTGDNMFTYLSTGNGVPTGGTALATQSDVLVQVKGAGGVGYFTDAIAARASNIHTMALKDDGTVWSWGTNTSGQFGTGNVTASNTPIQTVDSVSKVLNVSGVAVTNPTTITVTTTGNHDVARLGASIGPFVVMSGWTGAVGVNGTFLVATSAALNTFTYTTAGASGTPVGGTATVYMPSLRLPATVSGNGATVTVTSTAHGIAIGYKAMVTMAGWAGGAGTFNGTYEVTATTANAFTYAASGSGAPTGGTCILNSGVIVDTVTGDGAVVTVTSTGNHNLSTGNKVIMSGWSGGAGTWNGTYSITVTGVTTFTYVSDGSGTATGGTISGTGYLENVADISAGTSFVIARKFDGTVWSWGLGTSGQLGQDAILTYYYPVPVLGPSAAGYLTGITAISAGATHTLALKSDGTVLAWGLNTNGQLGDGSVALRKTPVQVMNLTDVTAISGGTSYSLAVKSNGTAWAWGLNTSYQLGDGTIIQRNQPVQVWGISGASKVQAGETIVAFAIKTDGSAWAWGGGPGATANNYGQIGDGTAGLLRLFPVQVTGISHATKIAGGDTFALGMQECSY